MMTRKIQTTSKPTQLDKFEELARELLANDDQSRWEERLRKVAKAKPAPGKLK